MESDQPIKRLRGKEEEEEKKEKKKKEKKLIFRVVCYLSCLFSDFHFLHFGELKKLFLHIVTLLYRKHRVSGLEVYKNTGLCFST
jgi:hypothetical protein